MTRPATGTTFVAGGFNDVDNRYNENRTGHVAVLVRDARGADTNISPHNDDGSVKWSPLASDGQLRGDLIAQFTSNGTWIDNPEANEGFHLVGAFAEGNGPTYKPSYDIDEQLIEQSTAVYDAVPVKDDEPFSFNALETARPVIRRLRNGLRLSDSNGNNIVELPGGADAGWSKPSEPELIHRQVLIVLSRTRSGKRFYKVDGYGACLLSDVGNHKIGKKGDSPELTFKPVDDSFMMAYQDGLYVPVIKHTWVGGDAWTELGTPVPAVYTVTLGSPSAGDFTLTYKGNTTAVIAYNAAASAVKSALVALDDGYSSADWTVTGSAGGPYTVTTPSGALTGSGSGLTGGTFSVVAAT